MSKRIPITVANGDGIGPEIMAAMMPALIRGSPSPIPGRSLRHPAPEAQRVQPRSPGPADHIPVRLARGYSHALINLPAALNGAADVRSPARTADCWLTGLIVVF